MKIIEVGDDSLTIDVIEDQSFDGEFYPRIPVDRLLIKDEICTSGFPLAMDVEYDYCFNIENQGDIIALKYIIQGRSTFPNPNR